jgi:colanic acid/amylovoran biosynthesis glycosyltransferase
MSAEASQLQPVAYITTSYPSLSHTFILREVLALRQRGVEIHTISLRRTEGEHLLSAENRDASATTYAVRPPRWDHVVKSHLGALVRHPIAYLRTLREALGLAPAGWRGRLWQLFYFAEAILVWRHCLAAGARHLHAHHASPAADVALLAAHFGEASGEGPASWSLTIHGSVEFWDVRWFRLAEKIRRARAVACISDFTRSQLMALVEEEHWPKLHVVRCGVTPRDYEEMPDAAPGQARILCVGRLVAEKGHAVLLQALALLVAQGHDPVLVLVGSGPRQASLQALAQRLGVQDRVTFAGAVGQDEINRHYAEASVFCLPSFAEGLPVVLIEAMACGRPVVATCIAGVRELVCDGETGLLVTPGRPDELAHAIGKLLAHDGLREVLGRAGRASVSRDFNIQRSAEQLERLFSEMPGPADLRGIACTPVRGVPEDGGTARSLAGSVAVRS